MLDWIDYPGLTRQEFPARLAWKRDPAIEVLHSTEGSSWPAYAGGGTAPHFTVDPRAKQARQHFPLSSAARALVAPSDGTHTNTGGAIQFEIIGTCVPDSPLPSVLDLDDEALGYLAGLMRAVADTTGIPLTTSVLWGPYPASYGATPQRLTPDQWATHTGVVGHQHVPGNTHGDPGALNVARLLELAGGGDPETPVSNPIPAPQPTALTGPIVIAPGVPAPPYPLPAGHVFGPKSGPAWIHSGFYNHRDDMRAWQQRMADRGWTITTDGLYGDQSGDVAEAFQTEKHLGVDRLIGPETWAAAWTAPVTRG
jgi:hypothetical protein